MAKRTGLGKGLGAIFGEDVVEQQPAEQKNVSRETSSSKKTGMEQPEEGKEYMVKVSLIEPNANQPRKDFEPEALKELAESIKRYGVLQPLLVQKKGERYEIIAGERRWRAAKEAGVKEVPVVIRAYTKQQSMEIALIENVQRADLNPIEEAMAYQQLMQEFDLTQEEIAERVSKNRATITNSMRLLKLDRRVQDLLIRGQISSGHARALLALENGESQYQLALKIISENYSVRETEKLVKAFGKPRKKKTETEEETDVRFVFQDLEERMRQIMGTKVVINRRDRHKGKVEIEYYSEDELERIVELIETIRE